MPTHPTLLRLKALRARVVEAESVSYRDFVEFIDLATEGQTEPAIPPTPAPPSTGGDDTNNPPVA